MPALNSEITSKEIRNKFFGFFEGKLHQIVPSSPIVVKNDPSLMFTNAGMNQFKDYFLGHKKPKSKRVANTQKCLRVSGKHNDLEEVGLDTYHHTMFEMLGNWSFGDYFKKETIHWAWELLTEIYNLPEDRLYASVFGGDKPEGLEPDNEAYNLWKEIIDEDKIIYGSKEDNFWEMGEAGPCGPCSEIHIDLRPDEEVNNIPGKSLVNQGHPLVIELWNLVFIQFNRKASGELENLPEKHVDTGMGLERLVMAIQGKYSNYDTDIFSPVIEFIANKAGVKYGKTDKIDIAIRVISDHIRAVVITIADGQLPSNTGAGYVIRRILRRAVRYGYNFLDFKEPVLYKLASILAGQFGEVFPEVASQQTFLEKVIKEEELSFLRTLESGLKRLKAIKSMTPDKVIDGGKAFELYDTYGFPFDLTSLIAKEDGFTVDEEGFKDEMKIQKDRSKADAVKETGDWVGINGEEDILFVGYDQLEAESKIIKYRTLLEKNQKRVQLVLNKTPFYSESGGQVGDTGYLISEKERIRILDTKKENDLIVHYAENLPSDLKSTFKSVVDRGKRLLTTNNHSATHLMHAALREVLGNHVEQRGSLVNHKLLRFDFSHFTKMTDEEIAKVEKMVNAKIRENIPIEVLNNVPLEEAKNMGAMALFGEKYGESVRVVVFDKNYSVELCGGTHVSSTGNIGIFKIVSESSIAAGIRRIEAITAIEAENYISEQLGYLSGIRSILKEPKDLIKSIYNLISEKNELSKQIENINNKQAEAAKKILIERKQEKDGINIIIEKIDLPNADLLKKISFELTNEVKNLFLVIATNIQGKPQIAVAISDELIKTRELNAGEIVKKLAVKINGGGGGQPFFATAGGSDLSGLDDALEEAKGYIK